MQIICPNCGEPVSSENINIQRMAAVCPACDSVFQFEVAESKIKRRKIKQPQQIASDETDGHLNIAFRTNFRLEKNENFLATVMVSFLFTFMTILIATKYNAESVPIVIPIGLGLITLFLYYSMALMIYNKTHIQVDDEQIKVSRKPLPNVLTQPNIINLSTVSIIRYEETPASKKEAYDLPRYNVWAEKVDGNRQVIVSDIVEEYAVFVSQRLNEFLEREDAPDASRLLDDDPIAEDVQIADGLITSSKARR